MKVHKLLVMAAVITLPVLATISLTSCQTRQSRNPRVVVLGFDGFDPRLCERMMDAGELPNLAKLRDNGGYTPLGTAIPPQSPVAWASFITGGNPGIHGIYDFIHRDPKPENPDAPFEPYYSAARTLPAVGGWEVGDYKIPLTFWPFNDDGGGTELMRQGTAFWEYLDSAGVPIWLYDIPANYPPSPSKYGNLKCLAGMGVPDLLGTYGTYQYFSKSTFRKRTESGGIRKPLIFKRDVAKAKLTGPPNTLLKHPEDTEIDFEVYRSPDKPMARVEIQDQTLILQEGEWSDWVPVSFGLTMPPFLPDESADGIVRFYLQQVRPDFRLYVSPISADPRNPGEMQITEPPDLIENIADEVGLCYTTGFQEEYNAIKNEVLNEEEYFKQANDVFHERLELLKYAVRHYEDGLLFFYFSSTDLQAHIFWWDSDEPHPTRDEVMAKRYNEAIVELYRTMDGVVGDILDRFGDKATVMVMSDHGFCNFKRQFNLNRWLRDEGYVQPATASSLLGPDVDWSRTTAYGLGLNGLYLNLEGRERFGVVTSEQRDALLEELRTKLLAITDPVNGQPVIKEVYRADEVYSGPYTGIAPDLIVGYYRDYRASWTGILGNMDEALLADNHNQWSADHCIAADEVPGVVFANRPILHPNPSLIDMAPTILEQFGVQPPADMQGRSLFEAPPVAVAP